MLDALAPAWELWRPATCMPDHCFCEAIRAGTIRQPANAVSSLAFVVVAGLVAANPLHGKRAYSIVYALALLVIGFGSAFYHASLTFIGQFVDVFGMYLIATFVVLYSFSRLRTITATTVVIGYLVVNGILAWGLFAYPGLRRYAFAAVLVVGLGIEQLARRTSRQVLNGRQLRRALFLIALGFIIWSLDITRVVCAPDSMLQGHAVWHILGATASWQLHRYYRSASESPKTIPLFG